MRTLCRSKKAIKHTHMHTHIITIVRRKRIIPPTFSQKVPNIGVVQNICMTGNGPHGDARKRDDMLQGPQFVYVGACCSVT